MAKSIKSMRDAKRNEYMKIVKEMLENFGEEVLITKSNTMAFPILLEAIYTSAWRKRDLPLFHLWPFLGLG